MKTDARTREKPSGTTEEPYTYHTEPPAQGGARYVRCERCGAEVIPADPDRMAHKRGCPEGDR